MSDQESSNQPQQQQQQQPSMDIDDWRLKFRTESRLRIVKNLIWCLSCNQPNPGPKAFLELEKIAVRIEEEIYKAATSMSDYFRKIFFKMVAAKTRSHNQNILANSLPFNSVGNGKTPQNPVSQALQSQVHNLVSAGIQSTMSSATNFSSTQMPIAVGQSPNVNNMASVSQNMIENSIIQVVHSIVHANVQMQMQGRPQVSLRKRSRNVQIQQSQPASVLHQQQTPMRQQQMLSSQQQQLIGQKPNVTNLPQNLLLGQQTCVTVKQQKQRLQRQSNNFPNLQQQQQMMAHQTIQSNIHRLQLGSQCNPTGLQQLRQYKFPSQQTQQNALNMVKTQGQQPQQLMTPMQLQSQLLLQLRLQQQRPNPLLAQQRLQTSHAMLRPHKMAHQQKQLFQYQRNLPEEPSTSLDSTARTNNAAGGEWHEEVYQKIKTMKDLYFPELMEIYRKIAAKLQQNDSLPHQPKTEQLDKLKLFKTMLERIITYLHVSKNNITSAHEEKFGAYERQIISFLNANRPRKPVPSVQQGQFLPVTSTFGAAVAAGTTSKCSTHILRQSKFPSQQTQQNASNMHGQFPPQSHVHSEQPSQQAPSQNAQLGPNETRDTPQLQAMNLQGSVATMQQRNCQNMQQGSESSLSVVQNTQENMMNSLPTILDPEQD